MAQQTDAAMEVAANYEHLADEDFRSEAPPRTVRAIAQDMVVIPETDPDGVCAGMYEVKSQSGKRYLVVVDRDGDGHGEPRCDCPDMQHNAPEGGCKHWQRVTYMLDTTILPGPDEPADDYEEALEAMLDDLRERHSDLLKEANQVEHLIDGLEGHV